MRIIHELLFFELMACFLHVLNKQICEKNMSDESTFQIVNFGADLLGSYYTARQSQSSILSLPSVKSNVSLSSGNSRAETPWDQDNLVQAERAQENSTSSAIYRLLTKDYQSIQSLDEFINFRDPLVRNSDLDDDSKGLFVLYNALKDLKTIAEYAGDPRTSVTKMAALEEQFKVGLNQVKGFISEEEFDKLTLLFGEKSSGLVAKAGLGKKEFDYIGPIIHEGAVDDPISSLSGGEEFTIALTRKTTENGVTTETTENINITVSADENFRTLETLTASINAQISEMKTTNADGDEVSFFNTRFFAEEVDTDKFALRIKTDFNEKMSFTANDIEPALYVVGNSDVIEAGTRVVDDSVPSTSFIEKLVNLDDLEADSEFHRSIFSDESQPLLVQEKSALQSNQDPLQYAAETTSNAIATDSIGNVYIVGGTEGRFSNHLNTSENGDAFLNKYDASGKLLWSRLVGSQGEGVSHTITIDADDNIIIAGQADKLSKGVSNDPNATNENIFSGQDTFVVKYNNVGTQQWMYLNDEFGTDAATAITTDAEGNVYLTGKQNSKELSSLITNGDDDAFVIKLDANNGEKLDYIEIGSSTDDFGQGIAVAADGNIVVATHEDGHFRLQKLDSTDLSSTLWSYDFGDLGVGSKIGSVVTDGSRIYISGSSHNSLTGGGTELASPIGGLDNFVLALDDLGNSASADWTKFLGTDSTDQNGGVTIADGKLYLTGTTSGNIEGGASQGTTDSFAMKIDATSGTTDWAKQLGYVTENRSASGLAFATNGTSVLTKLGLPIGEFEDDEKRLIETQTTARAGDYFFVKVNGLTTKKIEIKAGDTYRTLANRINQASYQYINASVSFSSGTSNSFKATEEEEFDAKAVIAEKLRQIKNERDGITEPEEFTKVNLGTTGNSLKIAAKEDGRIEIIAGRGDQDALKKLGLEPTIVLSSKELFALDDDDNDDIVPNIGGVFAFKMDDRFSVSDKRDARYVAQELDNAIGILQSAFRSLTFDPVAEKIKRDALRRADGPVPPALQKQLANYQDGLNRLNTILPQGNGGVFI